MKCPKEVATVLVKGASTSELASTYGNAGLEELLQINLSSAAGNLYGKLNDLLKNFTVIGD